MDQGNTGTLYRNSWVLEAVNPTGHSKGWAMPAAHSNGIQCHLPRAALHTLDGTKTQTWAEGTMLALIHHGHRSQGVLSCSALPFSSPTGPRFPILHQEWG